MAWRIDEHVVRGEIDNRTRNRVTGRIWFADRAEPVELDLTGNAARDLAGRRLEFVNPAPKPGLPESFAARQRGTVGDLTASRKVKVPDIPMDQIGEYYARREKFPWHWGNCLYLEWFSESNGRVVIETASFQLTIAPDVAWNLTAEDDFEQRRANSETLDTFVADLTEAADQAAHRELENEDRPQTEDEAEAMLADSDRLGDRIASRLQREGPDADFEQILEEELKKRRAERGEHPLTPEQEEERDRRIEELNRAAEEALANPDPEIEEIIRRKHPLAIRAQDLAVRLATEPEKRGWITDDTHEEHPVAELASGAMRTAAKLAGALNGREWPPHRDECGMAIAWLKRARGFLTYALAAADACAEENLTDPAWLAGVRQELDGLAAAIDALLADLRTRLGQDFD